MSGGRSIAGGLGDAIAAWSDPTGGITSEQRTSFNAIDNIYRCATIKIAALPVVVRIGSTERPLKTTDLLVVMRDCKAYIDRAVSRRAFGIFKGFCRYAMFYRARDRFVLTINMLMLLRRIAYKGLDDRPEDVAQMKYRKERHRIRGSKDRASKKESGLRGRTEWQKKESQHAPWRKNRSRTHKGDLD